MYCMKSQLHAIIQKNERHRDRMRQDGGKEIVSKICNISVNPHTSHRDESTPAVI